MEHNDIIMQTLRKRIDKELVTDRLVSAWLSVSELSVKEFIINDNFQCSIHNQNIQYKSENE